MPDDETSLHDALSAAYDQVAETPATETPAVELDTPAVEQPAEQPAGEQPAPSGDERPRDAQGRFAPKDGAPADAQPPQLPTDAHAKPGAQPVQQPAPAKPDQAAAPAPARAPGSWRPEASEHWGTIHPVAKQEILRREAEVNQVMRESHQARAAVVAIQQVIEPFMGNIRAANGGDVMGAVGTLLQADHTLRQGTMRERCELVSNIIKNYGVDLVALDSTLAGKAESPQDAYLRQVNAAVDQKIQPVMQYLTQVQQREQWLQQQTIERAHREVEQFKQSAPHMDDPEFRATMGDLMEVQARRGVEMTLKQAYDHVRSIDPRYAAEYQREVERARTKAQVEQAQRAKRAAVSLPSGAAPSGSPNATAEGNTLRSDILASMELVEGR